MREIASTIIIVLIFLILLLFYIKSKIEKKTTVFAACIIVIIFAWTVFANIPIENSVYSFSAPEDVYSYMKTGRAELVLEGNDSSLVIGKRRTGGFDYALALKQGDRFKLVFQRELSIMMCQPVQDMSITLIKSNKTNEYYIWIIDPLKSDSIIFDSLNSEFHMRMIETKPFGSVISLETYYFAYLGVIDEKYIITINGESVFIYQGQF